MSSCLSLDLGSPVRHIPLSVQTEFNTRVGPLSGCDWLRRAANSRPPVPTSPRQCPWRSAALKESRTDEPGRGEAAIPAWLSSIIAMGITTAFSLNQALIPYYLKPVRLETRTIKRCSWECCRTSSASLLQVGRGGGRRGWETSRDEKSFSNRQLGQGRSFGPHQCFLNQDDGCHVCVRSGESITFYSPPCLFLLFILRAPPAGSRFKGTVHVFVSPQNKSLRY